MIMKIKKLNSTITKRKLPMFNEQLLTTPQTVVQKTHDLTARNIVKAQRAIGITYERGKKMKQILAHDLLPTTPLFDGDLPTHTDKSTLVSKIESELDLTDWKANSHIETHVVVDVTAKMRQMPIGDFSTFGALIDAVIKSTIHFCKGASCIQMVFDSYV